MDKFPITINGEKELRKELDNLTNIERPKIIESIAAAREHGDLKENAEYHAAREQQSFIEGRIKDIKLKLSNAEIIDPKKLLQIKLYLVQKLNFMILKKKLKLHTR